MLCRFPQELQRGPSSRAQISKSVESVNDAVVFRLVVVVALDVAAAEVLKKRTLHPQLVVEKWPQTKKQMPQVEEEWKEVYLTSLMIQFLLHLHYY